MFVSLALIVIGTTVRADTLLFDRGLPTANLNNAAGADRSNVSWGFGDQSPNPQWFSGDDFSFTTASTVDTLRVWITAGSPTDSSFLLSSLYSSLTLYGGAGAAGGAASTLSPLESGNLSLTGNTTDNSNISISQVTYADGSNYQGSSGSFIEIWQIDFNNLNWSVAANDLQLFSVVGLSTGSGSSYNPTFMSASNAALGGSPADGADNLFDASYLDGGVLNYCGASTLNCQIDSNGTYWDKSSDINVQVFGTTVPEPTSMLLLGSGLVLVGMLLRRRKCS